MASIYDLSWGETSFLAKLRLFFKSQKCEKQKMQSSDKQVQAEGYSALSSTYYSIVSTAFAQLKPTPLDFVAWCFTWFPLSSWCYWRMLPLSNRVVELIGYDGMSADQCDVRQSVLRRRGKYDEAKKCIRVALAKNPEKAHTRGLLRVGLAEIYLREGNGRDVEREFCEALAEAMKAEKQNPRQAARIYRHCADIADFLKQGKPVPILGSQLRLRATELAQATGAKDQLLKL